MSKLSKKIPYMRRAVIICFILLTAFLIIYSNSSNTQTTGDLNLPVTSKVNVKTLTINGFYEEEPTPVKLDYVIVHLDFKGMPPKLMYLKSLLTTLKRHGVNGLLIEYEDMFPYEGTLANLSVPHHYEKNELKNFLRVAVNSGFEIIPLIQTFGHLQYVLKHENFQHLRESFLRYDSLCPSRKESLELVTEMLTQVIGFHQSIAPLKHVHIGCNEIVSLNECPLCTKRNLSRADLFMKYVVKVSDVVKTLAPEASTLIWWNMYQTMIGSFSNYTERFDNIEVVYTCYTPTVNIPLDRLHNVYKNFANTWIASAFKGVDEMNANLPNIIYRALNTLSWMRNVIDFNSRKSNADYQFKGIILTGWSRHYHFGPVCDLLVPSIPCLLIDLTIIKCFKNRIIDEYVDYSRLMNELAAYVKKVLPCDRNFDFTNDLTSCKFEGYELYTLMYNYDLNMKKIRYDLDEILPHVKGKPFGKSDNSSDMNLQAWCKGVMDKLSNFTKVLRSLMTAYYEMKLIDEYVNRKSYVVKQISYVCDTPNW